MISNHKSKALNELRVALLDSSNPCKDLYALLNWYGNKFTVSIKQLTWLINELERIREEKIIVEKLKDEEDYAKLAKELTNEGE